MTKFNFERELKIALRSNFLTKRLGLKEYEDILNCDDVRVLRENRSDLLFIVRGQRDVALINVNCIGGRIKMKVTKMTKEIFYEAYKFLKGGTNEH